MFMFMGGCQIIGLDEECDDSFPAPIHVYDIVEDIFPMIEIM